MKFICPAGLLVSYSRWHNMNLSRSTREGLRAPHNAPAPRPRRDAPGRGFGGPLGPLERDEAERIGLRRLRAAKHLCAAAREAASRTRRASERSTAAAAPRDEPAPL